MIKKFIIDSMQAFAEMYDSFTEINPNNPTEFEEHPTDAELAEAFLELGRLRRENARLKDSEFKRKMWIENAKKRAGYDTNVSFDDVFDELLAFYKEQRVPHD